MASFTDIPLINDFSLCQQTVTLYHYDGGEITRVEYPKAYFEETDKQEISTTGESGKTEHLVVIPGEVDIVPGDKVFLGVGDYPDGDTARWWRLFIPSKVPQCVIARSVSQRHWLGKPTHIEVRG
jgi:hypothetical protein